MKLGFSSDFYWVDGFGNRTEASLAVQGAIASGWQGYTINTWRTNRLASGEVNKGWAVDAFKNICNVLGGDGTLIHVIADNTYLEEEYDGGALALDNIATVVSGYTEATGKPAIIVQVGNEPYIGATDSHADLTSGYAIKCIALAASAKVLYPVIKTSMPPLGTFRLNTREDCVSGLYINWCELIALFKNHNTFDYCSANMYRFDHAAVGDNSNYGIRAARQALEAAAKILQVEPIVCEIGMLTPTTTGLIAMLTVAGKRFPTAIWRVGAGDDYDMIAASAITVPSSADVPF